MLLRKNDLNIEGLGVSYFKMVLEFLRVNMRLIRFATLFEFEEKKVSIQKIRKNTCILISHTIIRLVKTPQEKLINMRPVKFPQKYIKSKRPDLIRNHQAQLEQILLENRDSPYADWDPEFVLQAYTAASQMKSMSIDQAKLDQYAPLRPITRDCLDRVVEGVFVEGASLEESTPRILSGLLETYATAIVIFEHFSRQHQLEHYLSELNLLNTAEFLILKRLRYSPSLSKSLSGAFGISVFSLSLTFDHFFYDHVRFRFIDFHFKLVNLIPVVVQAIQDDALCNPSRRRFSELASIYALLGNVGKLIINRVSTRDITRSIQSRKPLRGVSFDDPGKLPQFATLYDSNQNLIPEQLTEELYLVMDLLLKGSKDNDVAISISKLVREIIRLDPAGSSLKELVIYKKMSHENLIRSDPDNILFILDEAEQKFEQIYELKDIRLYFDFFNLMSMTFFLASPEHANRILKFLIMLGSSILERRQTLPQWQTYYQNYIILLIQVFNRRYLVQNLEQSTLVSMGKLINLLFQDEPQFKLLDKEILISNLLKVNFSHNSKTIFFFVLANILQTKSVSLPTKQYIAKILYNFNYRGTLQLEQAFIESELLKRLSDNAGRLVSRELYQSLVVLIMKKIGWSEDVSRLVRPFLSLRVKEISEDKPLKLTQEGVVEISMLLTTLGKNHQLKKFFSHTLSTDFELKQRVRNFLFESIQALIQNLEYWVINKSFIYNNLQCIILYLSFDRNRFFSELQCWKITELMLRELYIINEKSAINFLQANVFAFYAIYFNLSFRLFHHPDPLVRQQFLAELPKSSLTCQSLLSSVDSLGKTQLMDLVGFRKLIEKNFELESYVNLEMNSDKAKFHMVTYRSSLVFLNWLLKFVNTEYFEMDWMLPIMKKNVEILVELPQIFHTIFAIYIQIMVEYLTPQAAKKYSGTFDILIQTYSSFCTKGMDWP